MVFELLHAVPHVGECAQLQGQVGQALGRERRTVRLPRAHGGRHLAVRRGPGAGGQGPAPAFGNYPRHCVGHQPPRRPGIAGGSGGADRRAGDDGTRNGRSKDEQVLQERGGRVFAGKGIEKADHGHCDGRHPVGGAEGSRKMQRVPAVPLGGHTGANGRFGPAVPRRRLGLRTRQNGIAGRVVGAFCGRAPAF